MISVVVLTFNEEKHIAACLESVVSFADELLVFDSDSTDHTAALARAAGARVVAHPFLDYPSQRNAALESAHGNWVFFIDADERADASVGAEIKAQIANAADKGLDTALFWIPRRNYIFGKWIQHTGWSPDYQPRVFKKGMAWFDPARPVHELPITRGGAIYLTHPLVHYNYDTLAQFRAKQNRYTAFEAQMQYASGERARLRSYLSMPAREFVRRFVSLQGYRDGLHGLVLSGLMAYYAFRRQVLLRRMAHPGIQDAPRDHSSFSG